MNQFNIALLFKFRSINCQQPSTSKMTSKPLNAGFCWLTTQYQRISAFRAVRIALLASVLVFAHVDPTGEVNAAPNAIAQSPEGSASFENSNPLRTGYLIPVGTSLSFDETQKVIRQIEQVKLDRGRNTLAASKNASGSPRTTVVLHFTRNGPAGSSAENESVDDTTHFEDQLKLARYLTAEPQRSIRVVAWIDRTISNHAILPLLASELIIASDRGRISGFDTTAEDTGLIDSTSRITYRELAKQRGLFPAALIDAITDAGQSVSFVTEVDGKKRLAQQESLRESLESGAILEQEVLSRHGEPLVLTPDSLRKLNISSRTQNQTSEVAEFLDLAVLQRTESSSDKRRAEGSLLQIKGAISSSRIRRWQSNLSATMKQIEVNTWLLEIDSDGGSLTASTSFANWLTAPSDSIQTVACHVTGKASADAALIALACQPLLVASDAILGGPGLATPQTDELAPATLDVIRLIASKTGRSSGLLQAVVNPQAEIFRFTHRKTGAVVYAVNSRLEQEIRHLYQSFPNEQINDQPNNGQLNDDQLNLEQWVRGEKIDLSNGVTARQAIELGLADSIAETTESASKQLELEGTPKPVTDQALVRAVERLGSSNAFAILLLFIGFAALSAEFSSPGLGVPGFIALVCFSLYFWIKLLAGTAEWLELVALLLGIACIAIEFFVLPGFGIFGIGGFLLTGFAVILMSQTFVIPRNTYQLNALSHGVWVMLGGLTGLLAGLFFVRTIATKVPFFRALTMESPDLVAQERAETIIDYQHLVGQVGLTSTPLHPSGKATFGEQTVQVISDGMAIDAGKKIIVVQVRSNHVVVTEYDA